MNALVGYTGFVGSNIYANGLINKVYNSQNIQEAYGLNPDLLIYAGLRAEKYLANNPKKLVLISTIDIFKSSIGKDENSTVETEGLHAYGLNRYMLECWVRDNYSDALIIRLPGLFGLNLKKNFIYDFINVIPFMLKKDKYAELCTLDCDLKKYYELQNNGFYRCRSLQPDEKIVLKNKFKEIGFTAVNFTDSRSQYQFYPLEQLWSDIVIALENEIQLLHLATEPVTAEELYWHLTGEQFENEFDSLPACYDYRTIHDTIYHGNNGYLYKKSDIIGKIKAFVERNLK